MFVPIELDGAEATDLGTSGPCVAENASARLAPWSWPGLRDRRSPVCPRRSWPPPDPEPCVRSREPPDQASGAPSPGTAGPDGGGGPGSTKAVKDHPARADNQGVKFDLARPTERQFREGLISGLIAVSITVPLLATVIVVGHHPVRWAYILGAVACIVASVVYAAFFMVVSGKRFDVATQAGLVFVMVCLAMGAFGFIELASSTQPGTYTPAVLIGVIFVSIIGDRRMRIGIDLYAIALVAVISGLEGVRGGDARVGDVGLRIDHRHHHLGHGPDRRFAQPEREPPARRRRPHRGHRRGPPGGRRGQRR